MNKLFANEITEEVPVIENIEDTPEQEHYTLFYTNTEIENKYYQQIIKKIKKSHTIVKEEIQNYITLDPEIHSILPEEIQDTLSVQTEKLSTILDRNEFNALKEELTNLSDENRVQIVQLILTSLCILNQIQINKNKLQVEINQSVSYKSKQLELLYEMKIMEYLTLHMKDMYNTISFFHPWNIDYRGRMYMIAAYSPIFSKNIRMIIKAYKGLPWNEETENNLMTEWNYIVYNSPCIDKKNILFFVEQLKEVVIQAFEKKSSNVSITSHIKQIIKNAPDKKVEKIRRIIPSVYEYIKYKENKCTSKCHILGQIDVANSAYQILSLILHSYQIFSLVNRENEKQLDLYSTIADNLNKSEKIKEILKKMELPFLTITREMVKTPIIATVYGGTLLNTVNYLSNYLEETIPMEIYTNKVELITESIWNFAKTLHSEINNCTDNILFLIIELGKLVRAKKDKNIQIKTQYEHTTVQKKKYIKIRIKNAFKKITKEYEIDENENENSHEFPEHDVENNYQDEEGDVINTNQELNVDDNNNLEEENELRHNKKSYTIPRTIFYKKTEQDDISKLCNGVLANFIHNLDSQIAKQIVERIHFYADQKKYTIFGIESSSDICMYVIHDCFCVNAVLRNEIISIYKEVLIDTLINKDPFTEFIHLNFSETPELLMRANNLIHKHRKNGWSDINKQQMRETIRNSTWLIY